MDLNKLKIKVLLLLLNFLIVPSMLHAWTEGLEEAVRTLYNGKSTEQSRLYIHEHINEINEMALSGDLPDNLYQSAQGDFFDRNYADLRGAAAQEGLEITMKKPERFEPGTDTDAPLTRPAGSDTDITVEKLKKVESHYKKNIQQHYEDAKVKAPDDIPDTNTDILVDPDASSQFEACSKHVNDNGGTAYKNADAVRVEIKTAKGEPISIKEASAYTDEVNRLATEKASKARSLRKEASLLEKTNPQQARKLQAQAQLADSQTSKYINRSTKATNKLRTQHGLEELPFDSTSSLDKAIRNIEKTTGKGRNMLTQKDAITVGNLQKQASQKASQQFIESLGEIATVNPYTAKDVQQAIAKKLNTMTPSAQGEVIANLERNVGKNFTKSVVNEAKVLQGIKPTTPKKITNLLTQPRTLGATGKKALAVGYKAVNVTMIAGGAYFMGKDGVYHALKNVRADQTEFEFILDVYKEAAWHGTGLGYAFEEAQAEELAMWKREIERGEPSDSMRKHITITIGKTVVYLGRDIVVGTLTLPYVFLEYLIGFEDAQRREEYSKAFLAEVQRQVKSKKEFEKAIEIANEDEIAFKDQKMYLNCMCSDCGGSLGGFFRPEFQGRGYGPCQCNGPLSIWKTPISSNPDQRTTCKEQIKQMNNRITDARMDELHKIAMEQNAKSVAKEVQAIENNISNEKFMEIADLFQNIEPLLPQKTSQASTLRGKIHNGLQKQASEHISDVSMKKPLQTAIKKIEKAVELYKGRRGLDQNRREDLEKILAQYKLWEKNWNEFIQKTAPKIEQTLLDGQVYTARQELEAVHSRRGKDLPDRYKPTQKDAVFIKLEALLNEKELARATEYKTLIRQIAHWKKEENPKRALEIFQEFYKKWEINPLFQDAYHRTLHDLKQSVSVAERKEALAKKAIEIEKKAQERAKAEEDADRKAELVAKALKVQQTAKERAKRIAHVKGFAGKWSTNYGIMNFEINGLQIVGHYTHDKGRIEATLSEDGKTMQGYWAEAPSYKAPRDAGKMHFTLTSDGEKINGLWSYGEATPTKDWHGTRMKEEAPKTQLIDDAKNIEELDTEGIEGIVDIPKETVTVQKKFNYLGCYKEKGHSTRIVPALENRVMNAYTFKNNMTIKECVNVCLKRGFKYAGLQYGNDCYCDNTYDKYGKADNCNMSCSGNKNEVCGGYWANSVYEVNGANKQ